MNDMERYLLKQLEEEKTLKEIGKVLSFSDEEALQKLSEIQSKGALIKRTIYDSGNITYKKSLEVPSSHSHTLDLTLSNPDTFTAVVISDTHFGNIKERLDYLYRVYDYCDNNDIHTIIHAGDLIDGVNPKYPQNIENAEEQLYYTLDRYPKSSDIINLICLGNHDASLPLNFGVDMMQILTQIREDLIPLGYAFGLINIENDQIIVKHPIREVIPIPYIPNKLVLYGHLHTKGILKSPNDTFAYVPSLSDIQFKSDDDPGFIRLDVAIDDGKIVRIHIDYFTINRQILKTEKFDFDNISYIENFTEEDILYPEKSKRMFISR